MLFQLFIVPTSSPHADPCSSLKSSPELQDDKRFRNNYSTFSTFSREFQDFILMILHPDPAHRIPSGSVEKTPPVVKLFHKFPRLFGRCSDEQTKIAIIENMTPSPTQAVLLQVIALSSAPSPLKLLTACSSASACAQFAALSATIFGAERSDRDQKKWRELQRIT